MKKTLLKETEAIYLKRMAKLNERKQKAIETYDPNVCGYNRKLEQVEEEIYALDKEYDPIRNAARMLYNTEILEAKVKRQSMAIADLINKLNAYDSHEVETIKRRWGV